MFRIEIMEADSTPWRDDVLYSRTGAWKRIKLAASQIVPDWPSPVWCRVYAVRGNIETLVYSCDLSVTKQTTK